MDFNVIVGCLIMKKMLVLAAVLLLMAPTTVMAKDEIVIGFTMSKTGKYNAESTEQYRGLKLWADDVNKNGGIYVKSLGKNLTVKLVFYDDESKSERVQQQVACLYTGRRPGLPQQCYFQLARRAFG